jgi:hypothetical protein
VVCRNTWGVTRFLRSVAHDLAADFRVLRNQVLYAVMAQLPTVSVWKEDFRLVFSLLADPGTQSLYCRASERGAALLSPFTFAADVGAALQADVALSECDEFRKPKPSLNFLTRTAIEALLATPDQTTPMCSPMNSCLLMLLETKIAPRG